MIDLLLLLSLPLVTVIIFLATAVPWLLHRRRWPLLLGLLVLTACSEPQPKPAPLPTPQPTSAAPTATALYLPVVATPWHAGTRGLAYCCGGLRPGEAAKLGIEWWYDYGLRAPNRTLDNGAVYVPYLWCDIYPALKWPVQSDYFAALAANLPTGYSGPLLFLNEPDLSGRDVDGGQCERTPRQAAYIYKALVAQCPDCWLIGPAVSHEDYLAGWPWLRAWYAEIKRLNVRPPNEAAIHTYLDEPPNLIVDSLFAALSSYTDAPQTAWVTEFGTCNPAQVQRMIGYYERSKQISRYAWFTARGWGGCHNLYEADRLTPVGEIYSGAGMISQAAYP